MDVSAARKPQDQPADRLLHCQLSLLVTVCCTSAVSALHIWYVGNSQRSQFCLNMEMMCWCDLYSFLNSQWKAVLGSRKTAHICTHCNSPTAGWKPKQTFQNRGIILRYSKAYIDHTVWKAAFYKYTTQFLLHLQNLKVSSTFMYMIIHVFGAFTTIPQTYKLKKPKKWEKQEGMTHVIMNKNTLTCSI